MRCRGVLGRGGGGRGASGGECQRKGNGDLNEEREEGRARRDGECQQKGNGDPNEE